ncbi:hypothetical protein RINTHH_21480 [Richelia intracellularis HH01]|jgi:chromosome segregation ATPase|uniref:Uncharacterized protein n=1 Tax=Richelia intracellularis HH01 TaxID=1165094 RepID=M1X1L6_9NOST|nr:hypothetical protein [Richelia intracellularis]CCH68303.1 hypothetical protein RINTHH_21480 [Richelia intracellularis HH01]
MENKTINTILSEENSSSIPLDTTAKVNPTKLPSPSQKIPSSQTMTPTKADLEVTVKELKHDLQKVNTTEMELRDQSIQLQSKLPEKESLVKNLNQELSKQRALTEKLKQEIIDQQVLVKKLNQELSKQTNLVEKLNQEITITKKDALQLAETNTRLTDEIEIIKQKNSEKQTSILYRPTKYPKRTHRPIISKQEEGAKTSSQMWLLD